MLKAKIKELAKDLDIRLIGFCSTDPFDKEIERMDKLSSYYEKTGYGHNRYVNRQFRMRLFPRDFSPDARTIIVAAQPIPPGNVKDRSEPGRPRGITATNYAREEKGWYDVLEHKLDRLAESIRKMGHSVQPSYKANFRELPGIRPRYTLLLRAAAIRSGIGQRGKNALIYTKEFGSFVVLSALYTNAEIPLDEPSEPESTCGDCTICQAACPQDALNRAYVLDAQSCMSIVYDEVLANPDVPIRESRRIRLDNHFVGCDICQSVCPKNQNLSDYQHNLYTELNSTRLHPPLIRKMYEYHRPIVTRAIICMGNKKDPAAVDTLLEFLRNRDNRAILHSRLYAAWALGKIDNPRSLDGLKEELEKEDDRMVRQEIIQAINNLESNTQ